MKNTLIGIFEDDKTDCFIYEKLFDQIKRPIDVFLFDNPDKGYQMAHQIEFDIVIIDIHFWGDNLSGINILKNLKTIYRKDIIAIAVTSLLQDGDMELILSSGFTMCIEKPVIFKEINAIIGSK